jgi:alanine racemase
MDEMVVSHFYSIQPVTSKILDEIEGYPSWFEIDLDNLSHNLREIKSRVGVEVMPVVKNNAYGHGLVPVSTHLSSSGVSWFMVAKFYEAICLNEAKIQGYVVNMGPILTKEQHREVIKRGIIQVIYTMSHAENLNAVAVEVGKEAQVFIKVDTGLRRVGVNYYEAPDLISRIQKLPNINVKGIFSTFMQNQEQDKEMLSRFIEVDKELRKRGIEIEIRSMASSDAMFHNPDSWLDMVRPGMSLYGVFPEPQDISSGMDLRQVLSFNARIEHTKWVEKGDSVTYFGRFIAPKRMRVGTLHVGFYDGIPREMANRALFKVKDDYKSSLGSISLNHCLLDLSSTDARIGDVVEIIGREGSNTLSTIAEKSGWMVYSLMNHLNPFTPRVYIKKGKPIALLNLSRRI